jgi:allantoin racemase
MRILVINPNATQAVTDGISVAVEPLRAAGVAIDCVTLSDGPPGIESDAHVAEAALSVRARIVEDGQEEAGGANAYVIACFSDPSLTIAREATAKPVIGISEAAYLTAPTRGERFGVISILPTSIPRHLRYIRQMGLMDRFAGDRAIGMGVTALGDAEKASALMEETGHALIEKDGADVLILGCAGMATQRAVLEARLGVPVIEPCQAGVAMALGRVLLAR